MAYWNESIFANATLYYNMPPTNYSIDGGYTGSGVLDVAREVQLRVKLWGYAWKMSGDPIWVNRTWTELLVCHFPTNYFIIFYCSLFCFRFDSPSSIPPPFFCLFVLQLVHRSRRETAVNFSVLLVIIGIPLISSMSVCHSWAVSFLKFPRRMLNIFNPFSCK